MNTFDNAIVTATDNGRPDEETGITPGRMVNLKLN